MTSVEVSISRVNNKFPSPNEYSNILRPKIFDTLSTNFIPKTTKTITKNNFIAKFKSALATTPSVSNPKTLQAQKDF